LIKQRSGVKDVLRIYLAPCINTRLILLSLLKKDFREDPSAVKYIDVLPEHKEWWSSIQGK
jgi:hypothetical protein